MRKAISITLGFLIAGTSVAVAQAQSDPVARIIAQEDAKGVVLQSQSDRTRPPDVTDASVQSDPVSRIIAQEDAKDVLLESTSNGTASPRPPDVQDAARAAQTPTVVVVARGGFDWGDAGIGLAGGVAFMIILAGLFSATRGSGRQKLAL